MLLALVESFDYPSASELTLYHLINIDSVNLRYITWSTLIQLIVSRVSPLADPIQIYLEETSGKNKLESDLLEKVTIFPDLNASIGAVMCADQSRLTHSTSSIYTNKKTNLQVKMWFSPHLCATWPCIIAQQKRFSALRAPCTDRMPFRK